jgi:DNA-binding MarR family transcriptional regulator
MSGAVARELKQQRPFASREHEVLLGLRIVVARIVAPWEAFLKGKAGLTASQYNVLRILRGSHPAPLASGEIGDRMIARDPDITRLVDRLARRGLVARLRSRRDRRVVEVGITEKGLTLLRGLDPHAQRYPVAMLGHLPAADLDALCALIEQVLARPAIFP